MAISRELIFFGRRGLWAVPGVMENHPPSLSGFANVLQTEADLQTLGHNETA